MSPADKNEKPAEGGAAPPLPPRKETFLAHYPRRLKVAAAGLVVLLLLLPLFFGGPSNKPASDAEPKTKLTTIEHLGGIDTNAAMTAPSPEKIDTGSSKNTNASGGVINPIDDREVRMVAAPDPAITEDTAQGSLPRISEDGRQPWQVYARPFNEADKRPRVAVIVTDLGLSRVASDAAITRLPANITLAFDVQSPVVGAWCARARQSGHETLLMLPMEPFDYPRSDPGPHTLLTSLPNTDNLERFMWALRQASGYVGVTTLSGSRFTTDPDKITPVLEILHQRGLMVLDARAAPLSALKEMAKRTHVPVTSSSERIDQNPSPEAIDAALFQLEQTARLTGRAVGVASPLPVTIDRIEQWSKQLADHGIALAPLSAMVE